MAKPAPPPEPVTDHATAAAEILERVREYPKHETSRVARAHVHALLAVAEALRGDEDSIALAAPEAREALAIRAWERVIEVLEGRGDRRMIMDWVQSLGTAVVADKPLLAERLIDDSRRR